MSGSQYAHVDPAAKVAHPTDPAAKQAPYKRPDAPKAKPLIAAPAQPPMPQIPQMAPQQDPAANG